MSGVTHLKLLLLRLVAFAALGTAALVAVPGEQAHAAPVSCTRTFSSGTINQPIPGDIHDLPTRIDVPGGGLVVADVDLTVNIRHPKPAELEVWASSYRDGDSGSRASLPLFVPGNADGPGADMLGTVFDDDADGRITVGVAPFTGQFHPLGQLSSISGFSGGFYQLNLFDQVAGNEGMLVSWSVTLTFIDCDADGDGVLTFTDSCPTVAGRTASGCPTASRSLSASYRKKQFRGALSSPVAACSASRDVTVWKTRSGPDRRVGTTTTLPDGSWRLARAKKKGHYYTTSAFLSVPHVAECSAVQSRTFRVR